MLLDLASVPVLETERLRLRLPEERDFERYADMYGDPDVMRYVGDGRALGRADAWRGLAFMLGHWSIRGYGMFTIEEKASGRVLGRAGLINPEGWPELEIGWTLLKDAWGQGFATEAASAARDDAIRRLGVKRLISLVHPDNRASIRVAEKIGERFERRITFKSFEVSLYALDALAEA